MAAILKIKDADGNWSDIPALVGPKGDKGDAGGATTQTVTQSYTVATNGALVATAYCTKLGSLYDVKVEIAFSSNTVAESWSQDVVLQLPLGPVCDIATTNLSDTALKAGAGCFYQAENSPSGFYVKSFSVAKSSHKLTIKCSSVSDYYDDGLTLHLMFFTPA